MDKLNDIKFEKGKRHQAGMTVPPDFFANFQANLEKEIDRVEQEKKVQEQPVLKPTLGRSVVMRWVAAAACAVVLVCIGAIAVQTDGTQLEPTAPQMAQTESDDNMEDQTDQLILSAFDDLYLYDLYCDNN